MEDLDHCFKAPIVLEEHALCHAHVLHVVAMTVAETPPPGGAARRAFSARELGGHDVPEPRRRSILVGIKDGSCTVIPTKVLVSATDLRYEESPCAWSNTAARS